MIESKLKDFLAPGPCSSSPIDAAQLRDLGASSAKYLRKSYFETGVSIQSPILSKSINTFVGAHSYMNDGGYARGGVFIGRYCSIGRRVTLGAGLHRIGGLSSFPKLAGNAADEYTAEESALLGIANPGKAEPTVILNDVWIGDGAVVMPGIRIGTGAVIGANAVVTRDVAPYAIVAGTPARIIRHRFPPETIAELLASQWWECALEDLMQTPTRNIFRFLSSDFMRSTSHRALPKHTFETFNLRPAS